MDPTGYDVTSSFFGVQYTFTIKVSNSIYGMKHFPVGLDGKTSRWKMIEMKGKLIVVY